MSEKSDHKDITVREFIEKTLAEFALLKPDYELKALAERFGGCESWPQLDRAVCDFIGHRQSFPVSNHQRKNWPPEAIAELEKLRRRREDERIFWENKRKEISQISGIGKMAQPPLPEPVLEPLNQVKTSRMTKLQKERLDSLKGNPGADEFDFFKRLIGLPPAQARQVMLEEYVSRFNPNMQFDEVLNELPFGRSWAALDHGIKLFLIFRWKMYEKMARPIESGHAISTVLPDELHQQYDLELDFWDRMRHLIYSLPKPREFRNKYIDRLNLGKTRPTKGWYYATCELCWRMVPYNPASKPSSILCFEHDQPSNNPLYRKHRHLEKGILRLCFEISKHLKPWRCMGLPDDEEQRILVYLMTSVGSPLLMLVQYLKSEGHDGTPESLLRAFHGPFAKMPIAYKNAMEEYIKEALSIEPFITTYEICLAEAWLSALQTDGRKKSSKNKAS